MLRVKSNDESPPSGCKRLNQSETASVIVPRAPLAPKMASSAGDLYVSLQPRVSRIARALLGEAPSIELVHDVCVDAALSAARFRGDSAFSSWLYAVVARHVHKWIRSERRRRSLMREVVHHGAAIDSTQPDELVSGNRMANVLFDALELLSDRQRTCVIRVQLEGHSVHAVAEQLGISPDAVRMNVHRARSHLRSCIKVEPESDG